VTRTVSDSLKGGVTMHSFEAAEYEISSLVKLDTLKKWRETEEFKAVLREVHAGKTTSMTSSDKNIEEYKQLAIEQAGN